MHIKIDDVVRVIAGVDKGSTGRVLMVDRENAKVVVEGVAKVQKHVRRSQKNPQGGRLSKEMPIDISNVAMICPKTGNPTRVGVRILPDGSRECYARKSGASLGLLSPPKASRKKKNP